MQGVLHFLLQCSKTFIFGPFGSERNPCPEGWAESVFIDLIFKNLNSSLSTAELEVMDTQTVFFLLLFYNRPKLSIYYNFELFRVTEILEKLCRKT